MWKPALFPDRELTPAEHRIFGMVAAHAAIAEHRMARQQYRYWTDPACRARQTASAAASRARQQETAK